MDDKNKKQITRRDPGFFRGIADQVKLIARLMADGRVNPLLKLMPLASALYFIFPDIAPGPIDDALVIGIATVLFVELCPPDVVQEHRDALASTIPGQWRDANTPDVGAEPDLEAKEAQIIEGEYRDD